MAEEEQRPHDRELQRRKGTRLLPKLASLAIRHADFLVVTCCISGLIALLLLPALAKNTYISENALIPGSASPKFSIQDAIDAAQLARELHILSQNSTDGLLAVRNFLLRYLVEMGADFYIHPFYPPEPPFSSVRFLCSQQVTKKAVKPSNRDGPGFSRRWGMNIAGILRAPRGEGNEAIVLVTPFDAESLTEADAMSLGLGLSLFHLLGNAPWLAKDVVWLAADSHYGAHSAVAAWLNDYHEPACLYGQKFMGSSKLYHKLLDINADSMFLEQTTVGDFKRAGVIAAGIVFNVQKIPGRVPGDFLTVYAEGPNGQMPNLDLINVVNNLAVYREGLHMQLDAEDSMLDWMWLHFVGRVLEKIGHIAAMLNSGWKFGLPVSEYLQGTATLTRSMSLQALGVPTGAHGAFRDYQLDAVTVVVSLATEAQGGHIGSLVKFGRLLEGVVRSVNNLLEKFHQSFFLYFLTGPNKFVSVGVYIIPLLLLIITLPIKAAALCNRASDAILQVPKKYLSKVPEQGVVQKDITKIQDQGLLEKITSNLSSQGGTGLAFSEVNLSTPNCTTSFARWALAVLTVCLIELWAVLVAMCPALTYYVAGSSEVKVAFWIAFSGVTLWLSLIFLSSMARVLGIPQDSVAFFGVKSNWTATKASTLGAATLGIGIMSSINFAAALAGAVLLVPMCLSVYPLQHLHKEKGIWPLFAAIVGLTFTLISSPPVLLIVFLTITAESPKLGMSMLWDWVECMWQWGSATYLYLFLVHLPCSILCLLLLLGRYN